jgi:hypothetical protein
VVLEYVLSVCKVANNTFFTLGGLGIGRKDGLEDHQRALFSIVSDHVAANLSAQMLHNVADIHLYTGRANEILSKIDNAPSAFHSLLEVPNSEENINSLLNAANEQIRTARLEKILSKETYMKLNSYFSLLAKNGKRSKTDHEDSKKAIQCSPLELKQHIQAIMDIPESLKGYNCNFTDRDYSIMRLNFDVSWIYSTIEVIFQNIVNHAFNTSIGNPSVVIDIGFLDAESGTISPTRNNNNPFVIKISDNGVGCDIENISNRGGSYKPYFNGYYKYVLNSHGDILIESKRKKISFRPPTSCSKSAVNEGTSVSIIIQLKQDGNNK